MQYTEDIVILALYRGVFIKWCKQSHKIIILNLLVSFQPFNTWSGHRLVHNIENTNL